MFPLYDVRKTSTQGKKPYANSLYSDEPSVITTSGGARRDRTDDLMLAKHALSQLSYGPVRRDNRQLEAGGANSSDGMVGLGRLELPTSRLSSARSNQLSYKPEPFHRTAKAS